MDGDDPADAARYGLVSGGRLAGVGAASRGPGRLGSPNFDGRRGACLLERVNPAPTSARPPHFVTGMPLGEQIARQISATDPTSRAIHSQRLEAEANKHFRPKKFPRRR